MGDYEPLDPTVASRMGGALGDSFDDVQIHRGPDANAAAAEQGADAFTVGNHVAFAAGRYAPGGVEGDTLLAHELTHVVQQRGAAPAVQHKRPGDDSGDPAELHAEQSASVAVAKLHGSQPAARMPAQVRADTTIQRSPATTGDNGTADVYKKRVMFGSDPFDIHYWLAIDNKFKVIDLKVDLAYGGDDDTDGAPTSLSLRANWGVRPAPRLTYDKTDAQWEHCEIDLYGDGSWVSKIDHSIKLLPGWTPQSRRHSFDIKSPYDISHPQHRELIIKSKNALPEAQPSEDAPADKDAAKSPVAVVDVPGGTLPVGVAAVTTQRWLDDLMTPAYAINPTYEPWSTLKARVDADAAKYGNARTNVPAVATSLDRVGRTIQQVRPSLQALGVASKPENYLEDIARDCLELVGGVRKQFGVALAASYDGAPGDKLAAADRAFAALWLRIASLYLQNGRGASAMLSKAAIASGDVMDMRASAGRGAQYWPELETKLGVSVGGARPSGNAIDESSDLVRQIREDFIAGKTGTLAKITKVVDDSQLIMTLANLLTTIEVFYACKKELSGIVGGALDKLGRNMTGLCQTHISDLQTLIDPLEKQLVAGADLSDAGKAAAAGYRTKIPEIRTDLESIQSRIKTVAIVNTIGKVLVILGAAALTGGAAGAAVGGALEGAGATAGVVWAGSTAAEIVTFTLVSRAGNQAVFGKNDTSLTEDLVTNTIMFGFLKAASALYGAAKLAPKIGKTLNAVGGVATGFLALQGFAELHFRYKQGHYMDWGDRGRSLLSNAVIMAAMGLGSYLAKPLNQRIHDDMLVFTSKHFPGRLEAIDAKIVDVSAQVGKLRANDPAAMEKAPELLKQIEEIWNKEVGVLSEAAKKDKSPAANKAFKDTVARFTAEIAKVELQLAQAGVDVSLGPTKAGNLFHAISPGFVTFKPEGKEILEAFHKEHHGTFEPVRENLYSGKVDGVETFYVPEGAQKSLLFDVPEVAGLKDDAGGGPKVDKSTDAKGFEKDAKEQAGKLGTKVGGALGKTVQEVELLDLGSQMQVEVGLRVLDPAFGKASSNAFKDAKEAIASEHDAATRERAQKDLADLETARNTTMKEMLDVLRDPGVDIGARKAKLRKALNKFEGQVTKNGRVKGIDFTGSEAAIDGLQAETFRDMLAVDPQGNLTRHGTKVGTLRALMEKVQAVNNLFRKNGVPKELALSVSSPKNRSIPAEVKVLSRVPKDLPPATKKPATPIDPTDPSMPGVVVDVGVGLGDFARDAGGETGEVVKTEYGGGYADPAMTRRDLTWEHTAPRVDADSVVVLGDALQTLPMMFGPKSVKRLFINNINAHYDPGSAEYMTLARGLRNVIASGGRVEVQWTTAPETTGGVTQPRGHVTGDALEAALTKTNDGRKVDVDKAAAPVLDFDYSIEASRNKSGLPGRSPPTNPVPEKRWVFTFH
jgi:hypothetical protein